MHKPTTSPTAGPRQRGHARVRRHAAVVAAGVTAASLLAACGSSGSSQTSSGGGSGGGSGGSASAGAAYFKGKTITMIAPDKPGGGFDNWARSTAPYMAKYLHATVNVENIPAGNTIVGQNTMASSKPDGLTISWLNVVEDVSEKAAGVHGVVFDPTKVGIIGATNPIPVVVVTGMHTPYTSFAKLASAPGPVKALTQTKGATALIERVIFAAFGVHAKYIAGYESSSDLKAGFTRGDGETTVANVSAFGPLVEGKSARPVLLTSPVPKTSSLAAAMSGVPTMAEYAKDHPPEGNAAKAMDAVLALYQYNTTLAAPPGTPADRVAALRAAMKWGLQQPAAQKQARSLHLDPVYESPQAALSAIKAAYKSANLIKPYVPGK